MALWDEVTGVCLFVCVCVCVYLEHVDYSHE